MKNYHLEWGHGEATNQILKGEERGQKHGEERREECGEEHGEEHGEERRGPLLTSLVTFGCP